MNRTLYIIGTGGTAKETAVLAQLLIESGRARWSSIQYLAESEGEIGKPMPCGKVTGTDSLLQGLRQRADVAIGIGSPVARRSIARRLEALPLVDLPNLIHPLAAFDTRFVQIGVGNIIASRAVFTCDIAVANFNLFNFNCTVGHDVRVGSFNVINPGCNVSGNVTLGDACLLGTGCQVLQCLSVASETVVGAGAVVTKSIGAAGVYVGVPARPAT